METDDILGGVRKRGIWVVGGGVVGAAVALLVSGLQAPRFEAVADVVVGQVSQSLRYGHVRVDPVEDPEVVLRVVRSPAFHRAVQEEVGEVQFALSAALVRTPKNESTRYLELRATAGSPEEARRVADAAAERIIARHSGKFHEWIRLNQEHERRLEELIADLEDRRGQGGGSQQWQALSLGSWLEARGKELSELLSSLRELRLDTYSDVRSESTRVVGSPVVVGSRRSWSRPAALGFVIGAVVSALALGVLEAKA